MYVGSKRKWKQQLFKIMSYISGNYKHLKKFLRVTVMIVISPTEKNTVSTGWLRSRKY